MLFTDSRFLFFFFPVLLLTYYVVVWLTPRDRDTGVRNAGRSNWLLVIVSLACYATGTGRLVAVICAAALVNYVTALGIDYARRAQAGTFPELLLTFGVTGNVVILGVLKFLAPIALASDTVTGVSSGGFAVPQLLVPIGLILVTCHAISYLVDVYQCRAAPYRNPFTACLYLLFLPTLIAGPILRHRDMENQFLVRQVGMAAFSYGVRRFAVGLGKTFLIASILARPADAIFGLPPSQIGFVEAWFGALCFSLQIYFDFSGYADMAIGLGRMLGFRLPENFKWPYVARSVSEFWQHWNISLTQWIRTYIGLSLDRRLPSRVTLTSGLMLLFAFVGLWHGPSWNVLRWGMFHGVFVIAERLFLADLLRRVPSWVRHVYLLSIVMVGWVIFRTETMVDGVRFVGALTGMNVGVDHLALPGLSLVEWTSLVLGTLAAVPLLPWLSRWVVTVDAMATSLLMLISTVGVFLWRIGSNLRDVMNQLVRRK